MADQNVWFKLWVGADDDPDLGNLSLDDFARWCRFGMYLKKHGSSGVIELKPPCLPLQQKFRLSSFDDVINVIRKFPNCNVTGVTNATVTWNNWQRYQGDNSTERTRRWRERVTPKKRREEIRRDKIRREENKEPAYSLFFETFWKLYPKKNGKKEAYRQWQREAKNEEAIIDGLRKQIEWRAGQPAGVFIPEWKDPERWIKGHRWDDELSEMQNEDEEQRRIARRVYGIKDGN